MKNPVGWRSGGFQVVRGRVFKLFRAPGNGSNYMRLNPQGHGPNPTPHGHGHLPGTGTGRGGQGSSTDIFGNVVPANSPDAHWPIY